MNWVSMQFGYSDCLHYITSSVQDGEKELIFLTLQRFSPSLVNVQIVTL